MKEVFDKIDSFEWGFGVFTETGVITLETMCVCLDTDDDEVIDAETFFKVISDGKEYREFLSIADIEDIFFNLKTQVSDPSDDLKLKAVVFYYKTDCFLEINA